jgi:hypothetical protein
MNPPIPPHILKKFEEQRHAEQKRTETFGKIREPIHIPTDSGTRIVAVRNRVFFDKKWKFFTDFLFDYGKIMLGKEWLETQKTSDPAYQHPLYIWQKRAYDFMMAQKSNADGVFAARPNGPMAACNNFYYDLYTVDDNSLLDDALMARLRHRDQFQGALHELFVEATCLRAGFTITRENEKDPTRRHVEFAATHKSTGQSILVEAKSRHRAGVMAQPGVRSEPDMRFQKLINDAIAKDPNSPLAIFVDTNLPADRSRRFYELRSQKPMVPSLAMASIMDRVRKDNGGIDPYNMLVFSNHPQHYSEDEAVAPGSSWAGFISQKSRVVVPQQQALVDLFTAVNLYGNVPSHFPPDRNA